MTPFCSQVTYEGLLDDSFGTKSGKKIFKWFGYLSVISYHYIIIVYFKGFIEFGSEVTGKDQSVKLLLSSSDEVSAARHYY